MTNSVRIMRCAISGVWTSEDMAQSLKHMSDLYNVHGILQISQKKLWQPSDIFYESVFAILPRKNVFRRPYELFWSDRISRATRDFYLEHPDKRLLVHRIKYGSEGFKDLAGHGEIVGHIKDFILRIIEHRSTRRQRELNYEEQKERIKKARIKNAGEFLAIAKEYGYSVTEMGHLVQYVDNIQETFIDLVDAKKIQSIRLLEDEGPGTLQEIE